MALFNYATKEITLKIVYYGPGLSGKTTNLQYLHSILNPQTTGKLLSLSTEADRTLFFDFLPVELGKIRDFSIRFQLYTVPGQVRYNATRRIVLKGADAVIFVADSQRDMRDQNIDSFNNMMENLRSNNINPDEIPIILQYNKRDLKNILTIDEMNRDLNPDNNYVCTQASAIDGTGVEEDYKLITKLLLKSIARKHKVEIQPPGEKEAAKQQIITPEPQKVEVAVPKIDQEEFVIESTSLQVSEEKEEETTPEYELEEEEIEEVEEVAVKEPSPAQIETPVEERKEQIVIKEVKEIREVPVIPIEKIDGIKEELEKISALLTEIKYSLSGLSNIAGSVSSIQTALSELKDLKEIKEVRREQNETNKTLKELVRIFETLKEKKSWFRF